MKKILISGDDFGLSEGINSGIIECLQAEVLTRISFLAATDLFASSVKLLKENSINSVGIHLMLVGSGRPLSSGLTNLVSESGCFYPHYSTILKKILLGKVRGAAIEKEFRMQIERVLKEGFTITHMDSHQHLHLFPTISDITVKLAKEYGIFYIRCPYSEETDMMGFLVNILSLALRENIRKHGLATSDYFKGFDFRLAIDEARLSRILDNLKEGVTELVVHPASDGYCAYEVYNNQHKRQVELKALLSEKISYRIRALFNEAEAKDKDTAVLTAI